MKTALIELDEKYEAGNISKWYSTRDIVWSEDIKDQVKYNSAYSRGTCELEEMDTDDQIFVDYAFSYLSNNSFPKKKVFDLLEDIDWLSNTYKSTYPIELLSGFFINIVDESNVEAVIEKLKLLYDKADPILKSSWRNLTVDASHVNYWSEKKLTNLISLENYKWLRSIMT